MKTIIKRDRAALEARRLLAAKEFAKGKSQRAVAREMKVTPAATCKWYAAWKASGKRGLRSKGPSGTAPALTERERNRLKRIVMKGARSAGYQTDFWTLARMKTVITKKLHVSIGTTSVWRAVISVGLSCQKPAAHARERNEKAITDWKLKTFPRLKKMGQETLLPAWV